jgi:hypothetical protein
LVCTGCKGRQCAPRQLERPIYGLALRLSLARCHLGTAHGSDRPSSQAGCHVRGPSPAIHPPIREHLRLGWRRSDEVVPGTLRNCSSAWVRKGDYAFLQSGPSDPQGRQARPSVELDKPLAQREPRINCQGDDLIEDVHNQYRGTTFIASFASCGPRFAPGVLLRLIRAFKWTEWQAGREILGRGIRAWFDEIRIWSAVKELLSPPEGRAVK